MHNVELEDSRVKNTFKNEALCSEQLVASIIVHLIKIAQGKSQRGLNVIAISIPDHFGQS